MRKYPIGIQNFQKLREGNYLYIDKTKYIYQLLQGGGYYFLSRPRRFGKSLLISILESIFLGKKELFKGLWIEDKIEWEKRPVIRLDFGKVDFKTIGLEKSLHLKIDKTAFEYGITLVAQDFENKFDELIRKLSVDKKVAILIDEYDKPIIEYLGETELAQAQENRDILKQFYSVIKNLDEHIHFFFLTGVSKFSKVSIFSDLNHLEDLTIVPQSNALVGYTQSEVEKYFPNEIQELADLEEVSYEKILSKIKNWYNGYHWDSYEETVYNPFSVLNLMKSKRFNNFWFETGTPTFLIKTLRKTLDYNFEHVKADSFILSSFNIEKLHPITLLFQTGYLTVKEKKGFMYILTYPNMEVRKSLIEHLLADYTEVYSSNGVAMDIAEALENHDVESLKDALNSLIAKIPYQIFHQNLETFYHAVFFMIFQMLGYYIDCEISTSKGRIDAVVKSEKDIFIIEFKVEKSTETAIQQIRERKYYEKYLNENKQIQLVGIRCFDKEFQDIKLEKL